MKYIELETDDAGRIKERQYIVRTTANKVSHYSDIPTRTHKDIGKIYKTCKINYGHAGSAVVAGGWGIQEECYRPATEREINYYINRGVKNIKEIPQTDQINYQIY